jgi:ferredoxin
MATTSGQAGAPSQGHDHLAVAAPDHKGTHEHAAAPIVPDSWFVRVLLGATMSFAALLFVVARRERTADSRMPSSSGQDLLTVPLLGAFLRWRHFNTLLLAPTLLFFAIVVGTGLFGEQTTDNPAILLTWILWWPAVIFTFFLVGRIWCVICPFGYVGDVAQKMVTLGRTPPRLLKNMWWRLGLFLLLTWFTALFALDRSPRGTAWLALVLTFGAVALAVVYKKRVFCRYVCPVGGIFGLYSMTAPLALTARDPKVCQSRCRSKDCAEACAWFQFAPHMDRGAECSLCLDCVRACPHDNLALRTQPVGRDLSQFRPHRTSLDEATTIAAILGVSLLQTVVMLNAWAAWQAGPLLYTVIFFIFGVGIPLVLLAVLSFLASRGDQSSPGVATALRTYAYAFLPLGLGLHAAHNFHHLFGEGGALWAGLREWTAKLTGWELARAASEPSATNANALFFMQWLALAGGLYLAWQVSVHLAGRYATDRAAALRMAAPIQLFALAYTVLNILVLAAPMVHRH